MVCSFIMELFDFCSKFDKIENDFPHSLTYQFFNFFVLKFKEVKFRIQGHLRVEKASVISKLSEKCRFSILSQQKLLKLFLFTFIEKKRQAKYPVKIPKLSVFDSKSSVHFSFFLWREGYFNQLALTFCFNIHIFSFKSSCFDL